MKFLCIVFALLLSACATIPAPGERRAVADALAAQRDWRAASLPAGALKLMAYLPTKPIPADTLSIYIEGDGFAWISGSQPSSDPTPLNPLALRLALAQPAGNAAYLARPCQYVESEASGCPSRYWTEGRFAPEVVATTNRAINVLKQRFHARHLTLVGYSGGGAVALLVAARRSDVDRVVTVAGNLDTQAWTTYHRVQPLKGSLNPADAIESLQHISQWYLAGGKDDVVPPGLAEAFVRKFPLESKPALWIEPDFDHHCCWVEQWPVLWRDILRNEPR